MRGCRDAVRRIHDAADGLDRETLAHCLECASCRRELAACLAAADPGAPPVPERIDRSTVAACGNGRLRRFRYRAERLLVWSGAAALVCFGGAGLLLSLSVPEPTPELDASALFAELADIGNQITETQRLFAADADINI